MSYLVAVAARWTKSLKLTLSIVVHRGGLAKNDFWLVATQKERIGEQLNYFWNMCPKPFSRAKNKRKLFSDGRSRGPLLARVALKWESHCWLRLSACQPRKNWTINLILPSGSVMYRLIHKAIISSVRFQLTCLIMRSMQFFRRPMRTFNNVRRFVLLSPKRRNLKPRISLLSY